MSNQFLFVGCLNREGTYPQGARGKGVEVYAFDEDTLAFEKRSEIGDTDNPTFLAIDAQSQCVYAVSEVSAWREGTVTAYRFDPASASLTYLNKQPTLGSISAYVSLTRDHRFVLVANYAMGRGGPDQSFAVFPIQPDGSLAPAAASVAHAGTGPNAERQERSHTHCAVQTPDGSFVLVAELGLDKVIAYRLGRDGALARHSDVDLPPGSGPRHLEFHPDGDIVFLSTELISAVHAIRWSNGALDLVDSVSSLPEGFEATSYGADLHVSPDGRFVYASNRGHDSIAVIGFDKAANKLSAIVCTPSGGATPRNFALTPSGRHLLVGNQNGDNIAIFARSAEDGTLTDTGKRIEIGTPMCLKFASFGG